MFQWETKPIGIPAVCRTNIDEFRREEWPRAFAAVPRKGERVAARSGRNLAVISITHRITQDGVPYIEVELHRGA